MDDDEFFRDLHYALTALEEHCKSKSTTRVYETFEKMMRRDTMVTDKYFSNFLGAGSYKEAYRVGDVCVKFAAYDNPTIEERDAYVSAMGYGIQDIFCPTHFIQLPPNKKVFMGMLDREDEEGNPESVFAEYVILQPVAEIANDDICNKVAPIFSGPDLRDSNGTPLDDVPQIDNASIPWMQDLINVFGTHECKRIAKVLQMLCVTDIYEANTGWFKGRPVITDWMTYI